MSEFKDILILREELCELLTREANTGWTVVACMPHAVHIDEPWVYVVLAKAAVPCCAMCGKELLDAFEKM